MDKATAKKALKEMKALAIKRWGTSYKSRTPIEPFDPVDTICALEGSLKGDPRIPKGYLSNPEVDECVSMALMLLRGGQVMLPTPRGLIHMSL